MRLRIICSVLFLLSFASCRLGAEVNEDSSLRESWLLGVSESDVGELDLQGVCLDPGLSSEDIETQIRQRVKMVASDPRPITLYLFGHLRYDEFSDRLIWNRSKEQDSGIPLKRLLRYATVADPDVELVGCFGLPISEFDAIISCWNREYTQSEAWLSTLFFGNDSIKDRLEIDQRFLELAKDSSAEVEAVGLQLFGNSPWYWKQGSNRMGREGSDHDGANEDNVSVVELDSVASCEAVNAEPLFELNFSKEGYWVSSANGTARDEGILSGFASVRVDPFAVTQYSVDLSLENERLNLSGLGLVQQLESKGAVGYLWVFVSNYPVGRVHPILELGAELDLSVTRETETGYQLVVENTPMHCQLVEGVWNLIELSFVESVESPAPGLRVERVFPEKVHSFREWKPKYDVQKYESTRVLWRLEQPQTFLDSVRVFDGSVDAVVDKLKQERYDRFGITELYYSDALELEKGIRREIGPDARLADWDNIVACFKGDGDRFIEVFNMEFGDGFLVQRAGERFFKEDRHYFFGNHGHKPRETFLFHDQFENYLVGIGSWNRLHYRCFYETTK